MSALGQAARRAGAVAVLEGAAGMCFAGARCASGSALVSLDTAVERKHQRVNETRRKEADKSGRGAVLSHAQTRAIRDYKVVSMPELESKKVSTTGGFMSTLKFRK